MRDGGVLFTRARCYQYPRRFTLFLEKKNNNNNDDQWLNSIDLFKKFLCGLTPSLFCRSYVDAHWLKEFLRLSKITAELIKKETGPQNAVK